MLDEFIEKLNLALAERDTSALKATYEALGEFIKDVTDLRENV